MKRKNPSKRPRKKQKWGPLVSGGAAPYVRDVSLEESLRIVKDLFAILEGDTAAANKREITAADKREIKKVLKQLQVLWDDVKPLYSCERVGCPVLVDEEGEFCELHAERFFRRRSRKKRARR